MLGDGLLAQIEIGVDRAGKGEDIDGAVMVLGLDPRMQLVARCGVEAAVGTVRLVRLAAASRAISVASALSSAVVVPTTASLPRVPRPVKTVPGVPLPVVAVAVSRT